MRAKIFLITNKQIEKIAPALFFKHLPLHPMSFFKKGELPFVVAGPCSAESEQQVLSTAVELAKMKVHLFRAGVWKPRTRPGSFEGVGVNALAWLNVVTLQHGVRPSQYRDWNFHLCRLCYNRQKIMR